MPAPKLNFAVPMDGYSAKRVAVLLLLFRWWHSLAMTACSAPPPSWPKRPKKPCAYCTPPSLWQTTATTTAHDSGTSRLSAGSGRLWLSVCLAHALDNQALPHEAALIRSATAIGKYWICKRAVQHTYEAMECIGGVGYVEENVTARTFREAPVNAIWEGSGNVQCLICCGCCNASQTPGCII